jgi:hypothetical protein
MQETLASHFHNWFGVIFFFIIYSVVIFFIPYYRKMDKKPTGTYIAFVLAFAIEMHGIPFSMYVISWLVGKNLPEGILWGHTLFSQVGFLGMYINMGCAVVALCLIFNGWHNIHRRHQPDLMTHGDQCARPVMRGGAGLGPDQARRQLGEERQHLLSMQLLHEQGHAALVDAMHLEHALRQVEPDHCYRHCNAPVPFS